jgi:hypothetical protein
MCREEPRTRSPRSHLTGLALAAVLSSSSPPLEGAPPPPSEPLRAGIAVRDITPDTTAIPTPLGGYGARENRPALGVHDSTLAKALVLRQAQRKVALVTLDLLGIPRSLREEVLAAVAGAGFSGDNLILLASHTHGSVEMNALNRRNVFQNRFIGIFDERLLDFTARRIAEAVLAADRQDEVVTAGVGSTEVHGLSRNRRGDGVTDDELTVLRLDRADGGPWVVLVHFAAHPTWTSEAGMYVTADWPGALQREVEAWLGPGVVCLFANGAEGDTAPEGGEGPSEFARAEDHGRKLAVRAVGLARSLATAASVRLDFSAGRYRLPPRTVPPALLDSAGPEYGLDESNVRALVDAMVPEDSFWNVLRVGDFLGVTIPGEMAASLGLEIEHGLRRAGAARPVVLGLGNEWISYILPPEEYHQGGYEPGVSFYGERLGPELVDQAIAAGRTLLAKDSG